MTAKIVKARKEYRCDRCASAIVGGEQYETETQPRSSGAGRPVRRCMRCSFSQSYLRVQAMKEVRKHG